MTRIDHNFADSVYFIATYIAVYVLATIIPPLLPAVFVVSVGISANRLHSKRISCTHPDGLLVAGKVDTAFFDKTGTLTKQGMDFISFESGVPDDDVIDAHIRLGMAVCHTLSATSDGELMGTHVDKAMFEATGAQLVQEQCELPLIVYSSNKYTILKHFEFDNHRMTQSVILQDDHGAIHVFVKGSAEAIYGMCLPSSLPQKFSDSVAQSAKVGIYQISIAFKTLNATTVDVREISRDEVECELMFGGFINFRNVLRAETPGVLKELAAGDITTAMITGDNVLTGIYIARESGMIDENSSVVIGTKCSDSTVEWVDANTNDVVQDLSKVAMGMMTKEVVLAITGEAWKLLSENDPKLAMSISKYVRVFGRCSPSEKVIVVSTFVESGKITLMCGDGQNDCGSLKAAHVGVALSSAEASLVAPFTSLDKTISSVTEVVREGRCALASALSVYSFFIVYGQTVSLLQIINAYLAITFTDWCWVFLDGIWPITLAFSLPQSKAAKVLTPRRPTSSLLGEETMFSVCGILAWNFLYLTIALLALWNQEWFQCRKWGSIDVSNIETIGDNYESSVIFIMGGFQYIASAMAMNFGYTFREGWFKNYIFVFFSFTWLLFQFIMTIYPSSFSCIWRVNCDNSVRFLVVESFFVFCGQNVC
jgi:predicted P-type ATPase